MKRFSAFLVLAALVLSLLPAAAAATEDQTAAADRLYELGLISGTGTDAEGKPIYDLDRAPTRSEAITVLVKLLGKNDEAAKGGWQMPFTDVPDWARNYVGYAYANGLTAGTSATTFGGDDPVTAAQYITFVLKALGYSANDDFAWDRAWELSDKLGVTDGRYNAATQSFLRGDVFLISYAALGVKLKDSDQTLQETLAAAGAIRTELSPTEAQQIIAARRDAAEAYMRKTMSVLWKMDQDFLYTTTGNIKPEEAPTTGLSRLLIKGGRIYRGTMYSYASGTMDSFLEYAVGEPVNGVYTIANLPWEAVSGGSANGARVGNDCTSSIGLAWGSIGANSITIANSKTMGPSKGYLRVGEYQSSDTDNTHSENITAANGEQVMYAAYAKLQKADAIVHREGSSGHGIMIVSSDPVYKADGTIDGKASTVTVLEQGRGAYKREDHYYDEKLKEEVYYFGGLDDVYTYEYIMKGGYLPVTCKEFIDPAPIAAPMVKDSCEEPLGKDTLLTGKISCNWMVDCVTMTINDKTGSQVQKGALRSTRTSNFSIGLQRFKTEKATGILGRIAPEELTAGQYHCKLVCRLVSGAEFTVRDFDFTV